MSFVPYTKKFENEDERKMRFTVLVQNMLDQMKMWRWTLVLKYSMIWGIAYVVSLAALAVLFPFGRSSAASATLVRLPTASSTRADAAVRRRRNPNYNEIICV